MFAIDDVGTCAREYAAFVQVCRLAGVSTLLGELLTLHSVLHDGRGSVMALGDFFVLGEDVIRRLGALHGALHDFALVHLVERAVPVL